MLTEEGHEYGSTTGRERRCGWLDLVALKYAIMLNGVNKLIMTKSDVLTHLDDIEVCTAFMDDNNEQRNYTEQYYIDGLKPQYKKLKSWSKDISKLKEYSEFPTEFNDYVDFIEGELGQKLWMISVGPERSETIMKS